MAANSSVFRRKKASQEGQNFLFSSQEMKEEQGENDENPLHIRRIGNWLCHGLFCSLLLAHLFFGNFNRVFCFRLDFFLANSMPEKVKSGIMLGVLS